MKREQLNYLFLEMPKLIQIIKWVEKAPLSEILKSKHSDVLLQLRNKALIENIASNFCDVKIDTPYTQARVIISSIDKDTINFSLPFKGIYSKLKSKTLLCFKTSKYFDIENNKVYTVKKDSPYSFVYYSLSDKNSLKAIYNRPSKLEVIENYWTEKTGIGLSLKTIYNLEQIYPILSIGDKGYLLI